MSITYSKNGFSVVISDDGSILVKPGDSLSKYSMAIHGNFSQINEYARKQGNILIPISNLNLIFAGETLYHKPSIKNGNGLPPTQPVEIDIDKIIEIYGLPPTMKESIAWYVDKGKYVTGLNTLLGLVELSFLPALAVFVGPLLAIFGGCFVMYQSRNRGIQNAAMRGSVYGITAWSFDKPQPLLPRTLEIALKNAALLNAGEELRLTKEAWNQSVQSSQTQLDKYCADNQIDKDALKRFYQSQSITYGGTYDIPNPQDHAAGLLVDVAHKYYGRRTDRIDFLQPWSWYPHDMPRKPPYPPKILSRYDHL